MSETAFAEVGDPIPDVALATSDGGSVRPSHFGGRKLVLFFYPKDDTPGCTTENREFGALCAEFSAVDTALLGVSKDTPEKHARFIARHGLTAALASDAEHAGLSDALGIWTQKRNYGRSYMGMVRTTYLIGTDGRIARIWRKVKVAGHAADVLAAARTL